LDDNWDIVLADFDDSSVYSISEGEGDQSISVMVQDTPVEETVFMAIEDDESDDDLEEEDSPPSPPGSSGVKIVFVKILGNGWKSL
ncbi:hypothetical protein Tco_0112963, partial [Tanacetum coccineum]